MIIRGVECADCGSTRTGCVQAGFDSDGNRIRGRKCRDCEVTFTTVEVAVPFNFTRTDVSYPDRARVRNGRMDSKPYWSRDRLVVTARVVRGQRTRYCRKGLHLMEETAFIRKNGQRVCTACRRVAHRKWWQKNRAKRPLAMVA